MGKNQLSKIAVRKTTVESREEAILISKSVDARIVMILAQIKNDVKNYRKTSDIERRIV